MPVQSLAHGRCKQLALALVVALGLAPCLAGDAPSESWDLGQVAAGSIVRRDFPLAEGGVAIRGFSVSGADARVRATVSKGTDDDILVVELSVPPVAGPFRGVLSIETSRSAAIRIEFQGTSVGGPSETQVLSSDSYRLDVSARPELTPGGGREIPSAGSAPWRWAGGGVAVGALLAVILRKALAGPGVGANRNTPGGGGPPR